MSKKTESASQISYPGYLMGGLLSGQNRNLL